MESKGAETPTGPNRSPSEGLREFIHHATTDSRNTEERSRVAALEIAAEVIAGVELALKSYQSRTSALRRQFWKANHGGAEGDKAE
jgi:hypothetical protein